MKTAARSGLAMITLMLACGYAEESIAEPVANGTPCVQSGASRCDGDSGSQQVQICAGRRWMTAVKCGAKASCRVVEPHGALCLPMSPPLVACDVFTLSVCDDGNACTADLCLDGGCVNDPAPGRSCSDNDPCTVDDRCAPALGGCAGKPLDCDDGDPCSIDTCAPPNSCLHADKTGCKRCALPSAAPVDDAIQLLRDRELHRGSALRSGHGERPRRQRARVHQGQQKGRAGVFAV